MQVKTLIAHGNAMGDKFEKAPGDKYECPEALAATLAEAGLVEIAAATAKSKAKG